MDYFIRFSMEFDELGVDKAFLKRHHLLDGSEVAVEEKRLTMYEEHGKSQQDKEAIKDDGKAYHVVANESDFEESVWKFISSEYTHRYCFAMPDRSTDSELGGATFYKYKEFLDFAEKRMDSCIVTFITMEMDQSESFFTTLCAASKETAMRMRLLNPELYFIELKGRARDEVS